MNRLYIKQMFVEAATELFDENGYDDVSLDDISQCCNKTRTTFYHYFKSKEELMIYMSTTEQKTFKKIIKDSEAMFVGQPVERLKKLLLDKTFLLYKSSYFKIAIKNNLFERIPEMQALRDDFDLFMNNQYHLAINEGVQLGLFIPFDNVVSFLHFYQKMQKGIEGSLFDEMNEEDFVRRYESTVDLAVKAISIQNPEVKDILLNDRW